jgi:small conductance mechanosensitive channel
MEKLQANLKMDRIGWESINRKTLLKAGMAIIVLGITHIVASIISRVVVHYASKNNAKTSAEAQKRAIVFSILGSAVYWTIMIIVLLILPHFIGVETTAIVAVLGSILFAIGLGLQGTLADLAAGVMLLGANTFRINDYIEIPDINVIGTVSSFGILYTKIVDEDTGIAVMVPNRKLYENPTFNHSSSKKHAVVIEIVVSNKNKHLSAILDTLRQRIQEFPGVLDIDGYKVTCNVSGISALGTTIEVRLALTPQDFQVQGTVSKQTQILTHIREQLDRMNVELVDFSMTHPVVKEEIRMWG